MLPATMNERKLTREEQIQQDARDLERLGYAQQLFREMGGFSNFAISFSIISILTGAVLLFGYGLKFAGPIINTVGWPVVSLFTLCVAASMAPGAVAVHPEYIDGFSGGKIGCEASDRREALGCGTRASSRP